MLVFSLYIAGPVLIGAAIYISLKLFPARQGTVRRTGLIGQGLFLLALLVIFFSSVPTVLHLMLFIAGCVLASVIHSMLLHGAL